MCFRERKVTSGNQFLERNSGVSVYKLPRLQVCLTLFSARNNLSALVRSALIENTIIDFIKQGCVVEVFEEPTIISPLSLSIQKSGKKAPNFDLRHINKFLHKKAFRCEELGVAKEILRPADYMFYFDIKLCYHHVDICPDHQKCLSFSWVFSCGRTRVFQFTVLPFGLSSAPHLFTKLFKRLIKKWR